MKIKKFSRLLVTLLLAAQSLSAAEGLEFERCQIEKNSIILDADCALFSRAENPDQENGKRIELFVARFPSYSPNPAPDAFTIIQGGPGMSSIDLYLNMRTVFEGIRAKRDILVLDQRGTGRSNLLGCAYDPELAFVEFSIELTQSLARQCLDELNSDSRFYTTSIAVDDLEALRIASGYQQFSLYGVSYGTRVVQHYLRRYPQAARAAILDGVADLGVNLAGGEIAVRSQQAFDHMVMRCADDPQCRARFGSLREVFEILRTRLKQQPVTVSLAHPISGLWVEQSLGEQHLLVLMRLMPYTSESMALLPLILHQAYQGRFESMAAQALIIEKQFINDYALAMNNAVVCTEDAPFLTAEDLDGDEHTYFGTTVADSMQALCEVWPRGVMDDDFREWFSSEVPVLLLSGERDPITPPENAERASRMFVNHLHIVAPEHGHGVIGRGCIPALAETFIEQASAADLNPQCVARERALPFFLSPAGPPP